MAESEKKLTESARTALEAARQNAECLGQTYIGTEHMILGIMLEGKSAAAAAIRRQGVSTEQFFHIIEQRIGRGTRSKLNFEDLSSNMQLLLRDLLRCSGELVGTKQILMKILQTPHAAGRLYLKEAGCDLDLLQEMMNSLHAEEQQPRTQKKVREREGVLKKYSMDLTELAREQKLDPVLGREKEMEQMIRVLSRRSKNNPCLVGEAGVGKTAIVEGLAQRIVKGNVPELLQGKHILSLDMTALLAGSKFRGEFEERIQQCLNEALNKGDCILFIDEIHMLSEAGSAEGATSAANLLKPQLARGELQVIGATTWQEHKRFIEKDAALARRFQKIVVEEPSEDCAVEMLKGLCSRYELHHGVKILPEAVDAAVHMSVRYLPERRLPDKALDLLDEAAAQSAQDHRREMAALKELLKMKLAALDEEKRRCLKNNDLPAAAEVSDQGAKLQQEFMELHSQEMAVLRAEDIAALLAEQTGIDRQNISQEEGQRLLGMEKALNHQVIGQEQAVKRVAQAIRCSRAGLGDRRRPSGSFLFMGPTGVGKTELCRALSRELFGSEEAMIRLDMSEFSQEHMVSRLIGAPPGYVGYQEGGRLTEAVRQRPYSLIVFDELEKAHSRVCDLLLQVLEEGELKDGEGKRVSFRNCVIVMTSNVGAGCFQNPHNIGFEQQNDEVSYERAAARSREELKKQFRPEFINRIDEVVVFRWLDQQAIRQICCKLLEELSERLKQQNLSLQLSDAALDRLCQEGYEPQMGARPLRRAIRQNIENPLADQLISGEIHAGEQISCHWDGSHFSFSAACVESQEQLTFTC